MATQAQRLASLEAAVAELRAEVAAAGHLIPAAYRAGYREASERDGKYAEAAAATRPRPRHLHAVGGVS